MRATESNTRQQGCLKPQPCLSTRLVKTPAWSLQVQIYFMSAGKTGDQSPSPQDLLVKKTHKKTAQVGTGNDLMSLEVTEKGYVTIH